MLVVQASGPEFSIPRTCVRKPGMVGIPALERWVDPGVHWPNRGLHPVRNLVPENKVPKE